MKRTVGVLPLLLLSLFAVAAAKAPVVSKAPTVRFPDTASIHRVYIDGDFEQAIDMCESALRSPKQMAHEDSVFLYKHLGVMYAAKYETREQGKRYMFKLLQAEPTARIMDMYASDMIYMIFKNIQDEYDMAQAKMKRAQENINPNPTPVAARNESKNSKPAAEKTGNSELKEEPSHAWIAWTAGAVALGGGAALYIYMSQDKQKTKVDDHVIP
jgi:hypothetical protein